MTKQCHHHFLVNQEKAEKHVFRKSKKYRTLCSVALGTMVTAVVAWGGQVAQADEVVTPSLDKTVQLTENPATNLPEAQPTPVAEQTNSLASTGQSDGAITVTVPHDVVTQAVNQATAEGVTTVQDQPMDLGNTTSASETSKQLDKAEADAAKQAEAITQGTNTYKADKETYEQDKTRVEQGNAALAASHKEATQAGNALNGSVDTMVSEVKTQDKSANVTITTQTVTSGDGSTVSGYQDYTSAVAAIDKQNKDNLSEYESKKKDADAIVAKNLVTQKENEAGLAKAKADNEAIDKRNQAGQKAVDDENKAGQAAVDAYNKDQQKLVTDREAEIAAITKRNKEKEEAAKKENDAIDAYNTKEMERYKRDLAEISKGEEGYISQALAQALNLNNGEPQARHSADTRNPNRIVAKGDAMLGGYSKILDSTGFFVYDTFKTGETLSFTYQNLQNARFDGKKITKVAYDITNLVSPAGTNAVQLVVPNDPTEGFIAYRNDGTGNWRTDKMEFRVKDSHGYVGMSFDIGKPKRLIICESVIDMMSYYQLHQKQLSDVRLVSMEGLKLSVIAYQTLRLAAEEQGKLAFLDTVKPSRLTHYLQAIQETTTFFQTHPGLLTLAVDNDEAGRDFCQKLSDKGLPIETDCPPLQELETKADWNDIVKHQNNYSLKDVIQSAKLQVIRSNPPPRKNTALEL